MKEIPLSAGAVAVVDDEDHESLSTHKWHLKLHHGRRYAVRNNRDGAGPRTLKMHCVIMGECHGFLVDHKNGNGLDNRRANLRLSTASLNQANRRVIRNRSGYKGVDFIPRTGGKGFGLRTKPWRAAIKVRGKFHSLGYFATAKEAAGAYDTAARQHFGEFAATNADLLGLAR